MTNVKYEENYASHIDLPEVIVCAGFYLTNGLLIPGVRHGCPTTIALLKTLHEKYGLDVEMSPDPKDQGFITNKHRFLSREVAWILASNNGQLKNVPHQQPGILFSEDIW